MRKIISQIFNGPKPKQGEPVKPWFSVRNEAASDCAEIMIYSLIGRTYYDDDGIGAKEFDAALKAIPTSRNILVRINSQGGNVWDGLAIYNMLKARGNGVDRVRTRAEGVAASIASVIFMSGDIREMPANALLMVHEPSAILGGNAEEMRKMADMLDKHGDAIAGVYAEHCDKSAEEMRELMRAETWMTGAEAKAMGLCDDVTAEVALAACIKDLDLTGFQRVPEALAKSKQTPAHPGEATPRNIMERNELIALLKEHGVTVENSISDADLKAKVKEVMAKAKTPAPTPALAPAPSNVTDPAILDIRNELAEVRKQRDEEKRLRITNRVQELQPNRFDIADVQAHVDDCMRDTDGGAARLARIAKMPVQDVGADPVNAIPVAITSESPADVEKWVVNHGTPALTRKLLTGSTITPEQIRNVALATAIVIGKNGDKLRGVMNTNTVSTDLKRQVIMADMIRAYKRRVLGLTAFSTVYNNVPLLGTNEVVVPYFPLYNSASKDFVAADGYVFDKNKNSSSKKLNVNKRKYQPIDFSSDDFRRQPYFNTSMNRVLAAEQLGIDVSNDVFSIFTSANGYATGFTGVAAAFTYEAVVDLSTKANQVPWPAMGRSLIVDSAYDGNLRKDSKIASALNFGANVAQSGVIPVISGFNYFEHPSIPENGIHIKGIMAHRSAAICATSPIMPAPGVLKLLVAYDVVIDPDTGAVIEYRYWGEPQKDGDREVIESNYGFEKAETTGAQLILEQ